MFSIGLLVRDARTRFNRPVHLFSTGFFYNYIKFFLKSQALIKYCGPCFAGPQTQKKMGFFVIISFFF